MGQAKRSTGHDSGGKQPAARKYSAPALEKGLDILELLAQETNGLIKSEVARRLDRTTSEVFRMLVCLQHRGYISQDEDERYRLTLRMFELSQQHPPIKRLIQEATSVMHDIAAGTRQSCHLAVIDDGVVVILAQVNAPSSDGFYVKPGSRRDLMAASSGYVILAHSNHEARLRAIDKARQHGSKIPHDLTSHLERIRRQGYEERESYQVKGVVNISFPILDSNGEAIAAVAVPFLQRFDTTTEDSDAVVALRNGARLLSKAMGHVELSAPATAAPRKHSRTPKTKSTARRNS